MSLVFSHHRHTKFNNPPINGQCTKLLTAIPHVRYISYNLLTVSHYEALQATLYCRITCTSQHVDAAMLSWGCHYPAAPSILSRYKK